MADLMTILSTKEIAAEVARLFEATEDANALAKARRIALHQYSNEMVARMKIDGVVAAKAPTRRGDVVMVVNESRKIHCPDEQRDRMAEWLRSSGRWVSLSDQDCEHIEFERSMEGFRWAVRRGEIVDLPSFIDDEKFKFLSCNGKNVGTQKWEPK